jgi:GNAT superfamily N-acetyltransferase
MPFSDLALARRLEQAEGHACLQFAVARRKPFPDHGSAWMEYAGANVVFDGVDSPVTQTFGLLGARGWTHEHPELLPFMQQFGALAAAKDGCTCFLAELDGQPGAAGALNIHDGVALFAGASTVPEMRRRGLQSALLQERMRHAAAHGRDLAEAGSESQRNAERQAFQSPGKH